MGQYGFFPYLVGGLFAAVGVFLIVLSARQSAQKKKFSDGGYRVTAAVETIVTKQEWRGGADRSMYTMRYPVFRYTAGGVEYTVQYELGTSFEKYTPGAMVRILVDRDDPEKIQVEADNKSSFGCLFAGLGMVFIVIGFVIVLIGGVISAILQ